MNWHILALYLIAALLNLSASIVMFRQGNCTFGVAHLVFTIICIDFLRIRLKQKEAK